MLLGCALKKELKQKRCGIQETRRSNINKREKNLKVASMTVKKKPKTLLQQTERATGSVWKSIRGLRERFLQEEENDRTPEMFEHADKRFIRLKQTLVLNW